jgi:uroporphyrin-III C-methyltransferase
VSRVGTVFLTGAGPGSAELLTVRAAQVISTADVIVHDRLIGPDVLDGCRPVAVLIDVSKRPGGRSAAQESINDLLIARAQDGLDVVRLKGGDPFVFGRGGEEANALGAAGVPFEIIPGVSSALAAPAAAGIPATHRELARSVTIITGHAAALETHDWTALAASDTLVVLMGAAAMPEISRRLLAAGRAPETPACVIQEATLPGQQELRATLADLPQAVEDAGLHAPLVLVVGAVAALDVRSVVAVRTSLA